MATVRDLVEYAKSLGAAQGLSSRVRTGGGVARCLEEVAGLSARFGDTRLSRELMEACLVHDVDPSEAAAAVEAISRVYSKFSEAMALVDDREAVASIRSEVAKRRDLSKELSRIGESEFDFGQAKSLMSAAVRVLVECERKNSPGMTAAAAWVVRASADAVEDFASGRAASSAGVLRSLYLGSAPGDHV